LCGDCESQEAVRHQHPTDHLFLQLRRHVPPGPWLDTLPTPSLYPSAVCGSFRIGLRSEWFFLAMHALHLGVVQTCSRYASAVQAIQGTSGNRSTPQFSSMYRLKLGLAVQLLDPVLLKATLAMFGLAARYMLELIGGPHLPLRHPCPVQFAVVPEYYLDDMATFVMFLSENDSATLESALPPTFADRSDSHHCVYILRLFLCLISSPAYVTNPYLRGKLAEVFCALAPFQTAQGPGTQRLTTLVSTDPFLVQYLLPAVIQLYIQIEHTGTTSQFYDKFNVRNILELIMNWLLAMDCHRVVLAQLCGTNPDLVLQFLHCLLTDMVFVIDEVIIKAESFVDGDPPSPPDRPASHSRRHLRIVSALSNEALRTLLQFAAHSETLTILQRPEMVERFAHTISYYVVRLLEVAAMAECVSLGSLGFVPLLWLRKFCRLYLIMAPCREFKLAVVSDGRSFRPDLFPRCLHALRHLEPIEAGETPDSDLVSRLESFFNEMLALFEQEKHLQEELGDIPEEFLDPILSTLMVDPVVLPASGITMERAVICRHLLSARTDPFCREPLTPDMLKPNVELRNRIEEWRQQRR